MIVNLWMLWMSILHKIQNTPKNTQKNNKLTTKQKKHTKTTNTKYQNIS